MSEGGGGGGILGGVVVIGILILINVLSWVFNWGFIVW